MEIYAFYISCMDHCVTLELHRGFTKEISKLSLKHPKIFILRTLVKMFYDYLSLHVDIDLNFIYEQ